MKAYTIDIDGTRTEVQPANGTDFKLEELYSLMGCDCIQIIRISNWRIMALDDNGRMNKKPVNRLATEIYMEGRGTYTEEVLLEEKRALESMGLKVYQLGTVEDFNNVVGKVLLCPVEMVK